MSSAQIRRELLALPRDKQKRLQASTVISWAKKNPKSELHAQFEWDDEIAAYEHRLWQARRLITIHIVDDAGEPEFVSLRIDRSTRGGGYRSISDVISSRKLSQIMFDDALADLNTVRERYRRVLELVDVWNLVDQKTKGKDRKRKGKDKPEDRPSA